MVRTQLYLDESVHRRLRGLARQQSRTISELDPAPPAVTGVLLDSDVIIEALRGRRDVTDRIRALEHRGVPTYCCAVSLAEIWAGVGEEVVTEAFFHTRGEVVLDALVAAAATTASLRFWTLNRRHYPMSGLTFHDG
jgi:hypothetical protein